MSKRIITINRQFGSNGHMIGKLLAQRLHINFYDKELIHLASEQLDVPYDQLVLVDEKRESRWRYETDVNSKLERQYRYAHIDKQLFEAESNVIQKLSTREDCIIVGRCADYILNDVATSTHVYLYAPFEQRIKTIMEREQLDERKAEKLIWHMDKERSHYYEYYTEQIWDDMENYDICLNTDAFGTEEVLRILERIYHVL